MSSQIFTCTKCSAKSCLIQDKAYPRDCMSLKAGDQNLLDEALREYETNRQSLAIAKASAAVESEYYCRAPRVEEIVRFAQKMNYKKVGLAACVGLIREARIFAEILEAAGLVPCGVICKVGRVDKQQIGIPDEDKINPGCFESMCNPVLQAFLLNKEKTDLNVVIGLCVGHDCLFIKYSEAPVTTLITKDRVMAHNPAGALYTLETYSKGVLSRLSGG